MDVCGVFSQFITLTWYLPFFDLLLLLPLPSAMASPTGSVSSAGTNPFASPAEPVPPSASTIVLLNIRSHVPVTLNTDDGNFRQWRSFFELTFKKLGLVNNIDGSVDAAAMIDDPEWLQVDTALLHGVQGHLE
jgi:hypothetical protein